MSPLPCLPDSKEVLNALDWKSDWKRALGINSFEGPQNLSSPCIGIELWLGTAYQDGTIFPNASCFCGTKVSSLENEQKWRVSLKIPPCSFWILAFVSSSNAVADDAGFLNALVEKMSSSTHHRLLNERNKPLCSLSHCILGCFSYYGFAFHPN